jgi:hypothetical protein
MTLVTVLNIVFAALVIIAIPGLLGLAIYTSPRDEARAVAAAARRSRRHAAASAARRPAPRTGPARPWAS